MSKYKVEPKRLLIIQPMQERSDKEILEARARVTADAERRFKCPVEVVNSFIPGDPRDKQLIDKLSLWQLLHVDVAYLVAGWRSDPVSLLDAMSAKMYGIPVLGAVEE